MGFGMLDCAHFKSFTENSSYKYTTQLPFDFGLLVPMLLSPSGSCFLLTAPALKSEIYSKE